jgi:prepilin-type N-terminal cleavage/methylation domain-containing protein
MRSSSGFTLIEIVVTVVIIASFSGIMLAAYPTLRVYQSTKAAKQLIQSELRTAQQRAIHRERGQNCLDTLESPALFDRCSEIGLLFQAGQSEVIIMANSYYGDEDEDEDRYRLSFPNDTELGRFELPDGVIAEQNTSLLFIAKPPTVRLMTQQDISAPTEVTQSTPLHITSHGEPQTFYVLPYGQLTTDNPQDT